MNSSDARTTSDLQWPELCLAIAGNARSEPGRKLALELGPAADQEAAELRLSVMSEVLKLAEAGTQLPTHEFVAPQEALLRIERGASASGIELSQIRNCLRIAANLDRFVAAHEDSAPLLSRMFFIDSELLEIKRELDAAVDETGDVLNAASTELAQARREVAKVRDEIKSKMGELISRYREALQDGYFAERDGRYVLPVRTDAPYRVDGVVLGTSGSGSTLYVEPQELGKLGNRLRLAEGEVERQLAIVLARLSERLAPMCAEIRWTFEVCARADLLFACGEFSSKIRARVVPFAEHGHLNVKAARHPLLCLQLGHVVPSDLTVSPSQALILSGPNAGGKTVVLKTLGLLALMQQSGLPVPVDAESSIGFFDEVLCDIGDDQSLSMSLSTFSGHVERVVQIIEEAGHGTLVLFDELMGGTDPDEGAVLAIATIEALTAAGSAVCVTTHYEALKQQANDSPHFFNGAVGFDFEKMEPTFTVTMGRPGASSALIVAERFGLSSSITKRAETLLPESLAKHRKERIFSEQLLTELQTERALLARAKDEQLEINRRLLLELERQKDSQTRELAREGDALRAEVKAARATIRQVQTRLKQANAEELAELQSQLDGAARVDSIKSQLHRKLSPQHRAPKPVLEERIVPGCHVSISGFSSSAEVLEAPKKGSVRVMLGVMKMNVALADIVAIVERGAQGSSPNKNTQGERRLKGAVQTNSEAQLIRSEDITLDLRGQRVEDALLLADQFIDELLRRHEIGGFVLHGHGTGALKEAIRAHLRSHQCVRESRPAERDEGGDAFTLFWFAI